MDPLRARGYIIGFLTLEALIIISIATFFIWAPAILMNFIYLWIGHGFWHPICMALGFGDCHCEACMAERLEHQRMQYRDGVPHMGGLMSPGGRLYPFERL